MPTEITSNIQELASKMGVKAERVKMAVQWGLDESGKMAVKQEKAFLTPHSKSGKLIKSIQMIPTGEYSRSVGPMMDEIYPMSIEFGRKGFCAKGLREGAPDKGSFFAGANVGAVGFAHALRFEYNGQMIFRKCVGPAKATPFVAPTRNSMRAMFPKIMQKNVEKALSRD